MERQDPFASLQRAALEQARAPVNQSVAAAKKMRTRRKLPPGKRRQTFDLPVEVLDKIKQVAGRLRISQSTVVGWAVITAFSEHKEDDIIDMLKPARAPRFEYVLDVSRLKDK